MRYKELMELLYENERLNAMLDDDEAEKLFRYIEERILSLEYEEARKKLMQFLRRLGETHPLRLAKEIFGT